MRRAAEIVGCIILSVANLLLWPIAKATEKLGEWLDDDGTRTTTLGLITKGDDCEQHSRVCSIKTGCIQGQVE